jgi:outer membrane protein assembly factor BamB
MKILIVAITISLIIISMSMAQVTENWRGPDRQGIYYETGLLQEWPAGGPAMLWAFLELGNGFSSPVIANGKIYVTGKEDGTGYIYVLSMDGRIENKFEYGPEFHGEGYPGSRNTPAVVNNTIYMVSSNGVMACMDTNTGRIIWRRDLFNDFNGRNIRWGLTENLLVDGDRIYCAPGGRKHNIVALNRHNGEIIWSSEGTGELSAYCSPLLVDHYGRKLLITHMENNIVALDANTGRLMWSHHHSNRWDVHPNTPIYHQGSIYAFSGYGQGGVKLKINSVADAVTVEWTNNLDNQMGGAVLVDGYIYGSGQNNRFWICVDWETGETIYRSSDIAKGTLIWAEGRLYCYSDRGELALMEPTPNGFEIRGQTDITLGSGQHWAHLVIDNGVLYVRRGNALMAFDIGR